MTSKHEISATGEKENIIMYYLLLILDWFRPIRGPVDYYFMCSFVEDIYVMTKQLEFVCIDEVGQCVYRMQ